MIIHIDMDAFFASVEQMDDPSLRGKPVIVGGSSDRGVVSTCSYEARAFGVHSAMPMVVARRLCPQAIIVRGRYPRYSELSHAIMNALRDFSPLVEPASVDEAYVDATGLERLFGPLEDLVTAIKARIEEVTGGLTCSVGAAPVKFLAKICSEVNKPDGFFILYPENVDAFLCALPVGKIPGVGKRMVQSLQDLGIKTVGQLRRFSPEVMERRFGKWGAVLYERVHGRDSRKVETALFRSMYLCAGHAGQDFSAAHAHGPCRARGRLPAQARLQGPHHYPQGKVLRLQADHALPHTGRAHQRHGNHF